MPSSARLYPLRFSEQDFWRNLLACAVTGAAGSILFHKTYGSCGDYPQHFAASLWGIGIGFAAGLIFNVLHAKIPYAWRLRPVLSGLLRYFLASIMLTYALAKIIPMQFPHLWANMDSTLGELSPMRFAWTFFGHSKGYQMMLGWAEAIPAVLLLFRRTSLLGAFLMTPVLIQVLAVNFFFDVCVKLNSSIYLGIAIFLLISEWERLWAFFISGKGVPAQAHPVLFQGAKARRIARILNGLAIAGILGYAAYDSTEVWDYYQKQEVATPVSGVWHVEKMEQFRDTTWALIPADDSLYLERIYFQGIYGTLKGPKRRNRVILDIKPGKPGINLTFITTNNERPLKRVWQYKMHDSTNLELCGRLWNDSVRVACKRLEPGMK